MVLSPQKNRTWSRVKFTYSLQVSIISVSCRSSLASLATEMGIACRTLRKAFKASLNLPVVTILRASLARSKITWHARHRNFSQLTGSSNISTSYQNIVIQNETSIIMKNIITPLQFPGFLEHVFSCFLRYRKSLWNSRTASHPCHDRPPAEWRESSEPSPVLWRFPHWAAASAAKASAARPVERYRSPNRPLWRWPPGVLHWSSPDVASTSSRLLRNLQQPPNHRANVAFSAISLGNCHPRSGSNHDLPHELVLPADLPNLPSPDHHPSRHHPCHRPDPIRSPGRARKAKWHQLSMSQPNFYRSIGN